MIHEEGKKKTHILSFDHKCGNKHKHNRTVLKLPQALLADKIHRQRNTWRGKTKKQKKKEKLILRTNGGPGERREGRKGGHRFGFLPSLDSSPLWVDFHFRSSPLCPLYITVQQWFSFSFAYFSHIQDICPFLRGWQDADDMLVQRILLSFVSSVSVKLR